MKRLLLLSALAASFVSLHADTFSDTFALSYNDQPIANGDVITCDNFFNEWYDPTYPDDPANYKAMATIKATNISNRAHALNFLLSVDTPSPDEFFKKANGFGNLQVCYGYDFGTGNCIPTKNHVVSGTTNMEIPHGSYATFDVDQSGFKVMTPVTLKFELSFDDASATIYVKFNHTKDITLGVDEIETGDDTTEFYTLQGVRVAEPQKGNIYIVRTNKKVSKRLF